ncbi:TBC1 domain family member 19 [Dendroctonus ponderosae]|uniref:TBC1 domain family member 19 n=1 Tax=Dendroctonus ponderosae TaxID=77166 RepID=UPI00203616D2|nr:TBC1 domain family member 19 [Dendroctonus ponderosae]XP_048517538.1 TBC1 domain family member 19 [Dendroctonus ponderosae]
MEELKDCSIHHTTIKICEDLKNATEYKTFFEDVQKLVSTPNVRVEDFKNSLLKAMQDHGLEAELKNNIYRWVKTKKNNSSPYDSFFRKAQIHWDKRIHKSLNSMSSELGISLARLRGTNEKEEIANKWNELSNFEVDIHKYRPVYAPKDFLEVLINLKGPCKEEVKSDLNKWEFAQMPLKVKNLVELRNMYAELSRGDLILNSNNFVNPSQNYATLEAERIALGEKILAKNYAPLAQEFLKKGCPKCMRSKMWTLILGADVKPVQIAHFDSLKQNVLQYDLMIDKLIIKDINLTASNDDQYFVFEDVLYQVMMCFSRDSDILKQLPNQPAFLQVGLKGRPNTAENTLVFPPSGVIPFHGFTMYAAPFCYLYNNAVELYFAFRGFYLRYWHRLHRVCASPQGIVALCLQFEKLLQCFEPSLWHHFKKCRIHPLRVVIKWMMRAFSGHLPPEQLLTLWDIILAYDSLEVVPVLALAIVVFRKQNLMKVNTLANIEAVLADLSSIAVVPLLQMAFIKDN